MTDHVPRQPEPEVMDDAQAAQTYALSDFSEVNRASALPPPFLLAGAGQVVQTVNIASRVHGRNSAHPPP